MTEVGRRRHRPAEDNQHFGLAPADLVEQPLKGERDEDRGSRGDEIADDAKTEEQFVGRDFLGRIHPIAAASDASARAFSARRWPVELSAKWENQPCSCGDSSP